MTRNIPITRRSINELLQLLLDNIDQIRCDGYIHGLCGVANHLFCDSSLNRTECETLIAYIYNNKPLNYRTILGYESERDRSKWLVVPNLIVIKRKQIEQIKQNFSITLRTLIGSDS